MSQPIPNKPRLLARQRAGIAVIVAAALLNKWSIEAVLSYDGHIASLRTIAAIVLLQMAGLAIGGWLLLTKRHLITRWLNIIMIGAMAASVFGGYAALRLLGVAADPQASVKAAWQRVNRTEDFILQLAGDMQALSRAAYNFELLDERTVELFDPRLVGDAGAAGAASAADLSTLFKHERDDAIARAREELAPLVFWRAQLAPFKYFEHAKFKVVAGEFVDPDLFRADVRFSGLGKLKSGGWRSIKSRLRLDIKLIESPRSPRPHRIHRFQTTTFDIAERPQRMFSNALEQAFPERALRERVQHSGHHEQLLRWLAQPDPNKLPTPHFSPISVDRHPGIAVVDIDADGYDDIYLTVRVGRNMLLHNRGDGSFEEIAAQLGLAIEGQSSSAIFADFDNDGDQDVFIGRTLTPSLYLENVKGHFVDRSGSAVDQPLPSLVSSISAVDYNNDGLLDVYLSTYAASMLQSGDAGGKVAGDYRIPDGMLVPADVAQLKTLLGEAHEFLAMPGPPNIMLRNIGEGRFSAALAPAKLRAFRNTYQTTWADYDNDGDQDGYLVNDYSENILLVNERGHFSDATSVMDVADYGFGMGASFGDYDNDGRLDLYVSNMHSTAGLRITAGLPLISSYRKAARGNSLFSGVGLNTRLASGSQHPSQPVDDAGWSWGAQFADFDNDTRLDIYAPNGYYTAPAAFDAPYDF